MADEPTGAEGHDEMVLFPALHDPAGLRKKNRKKDINS